jgi:hypothetical protein
MPRPRSLPKSFYNENFKSLAKKQKDKQYDRKAKSKCQAAHKSG